MKLTVKQTKALDFLEDKATTEVYYGGAAGGGKSFFGCYWLLKSVFKYPGSRWLMGRSELKNLKKTTLNSFFEVCKVQGIKADLHYKYNQQESTFKFINGSEILLADLFAYPSDPEFDNLGSLEITGSFIDEAPQVTDKAKNIVKSRIRYKLDEFGLIPKLLMCGNPSKNWAYYEFYQPSKEGRLRVDRKFIQALVTDNPYISPHYIESLRGLDQNSRERLLNGNWEYDDDPAALISYEKILDCFTNDFVQPGDYHLSIDVARFGSDSTVICLWNGYRCSFQQYFKKSIPEIAEIVRGLQGQFNIPNIRTIADEDGVGGGVVDILKCKGFVNNSSPLPNPLQMMEKENYANLKSQCYFRLAERINKGGLYIDCKDNGIKAKVIQELEQVKQYNMDKDSKKQVLPKDKVKELIGRSPDFSDALMMREWFDLAPQFVVSVA